MKSALARVADEHAPIPLRRSAARDRHREPGTLRHAASVIRTHWCCAALVAVAATSALARELTETSQWRILLMDTHRQVGLLVLLGLGIRLTLRLRVGLANTTAHLPRPLRLAAHAAHLLLYGLLLAIPLLGWALSNAHGLTVHLFAVLPLPALTGADADLADTLSDWHVLACWVLLAAVAAHVAAALWHHLVRRDQVLVAMLPAVPARPLSRPEFQPASTLTDRWTGRLRRAR